MYKATNNLQKMIDEQSELFVYYAGHGLNYQSDNRLLAADFDISVIQQTSLLQSEFIDMIAKANPRSVTIIFDTCFSGISRDEKTLLASARPVRIVSSEQNDIPKNFTIFSASKLDQISSGFSEAKNGIFSYYLMKGLEGKADSNKDRKITNGELLAYMIENVSQKAAELGREQTPSFVGDKDKVLTRY